MIETRKHNIVLIIIILFSGTIFFQYLWPMFIGLLDKFIEKSSQTVGGYGNVWAMIITIPLLSSFMVCIFVSRPAVVVGLFMLLFPFLGRSRDFLFKIISYHHMMPEKIGVTSIMVIITLIVFNIRKIPMRLPSSKLFRRCEISLWLFAGLGTFSQLYNHQPLEALLLSFNGMWQYLLWFYLVMGATRERSDIRFLLWCFILMLMINIPYRFLIYGELFNVHWAERTFVDVHRYTAGAFGAAGGNAIISLVAFIIISYLYINISSAAEKGLLLFISNMIIIDIFISFTRLAIIMLIFILICFILWRQTRRFAVIIAFFLIGELALFHIFWPGDLITVLTARSSFQGEDLSRKELFFMAIPDIFHNIGFGFGILKEPEYLTSWTKKPLPVHNAFLLLSQSVGLWSATAWMYFLLAPIIFFFKKFRGGNPSPDSALGPFLIIALATWIIYVSVAGATVTYYSPFELNQTYYALVALAISCLYIEAGKPQKRHSLPTKRSPYIAVRIIYLFQRNYSI